MRIHSVKAYSFDVDFVIRYIFINVDDATKAYYSRFPIETKYVFISRQGK